MSLWTGGNKATVHKGKCKECGRKELVELPPFKGSKKKRLDFHFAPCGSQCPGGKVSNVQEDMDMGVHQANCSCGPVL